MANFKNTVFMNRRFTEHPGTVVGRTWDGYTKCLIKGDVDKNYFSVRSGYTFGQVLSNEMNIKMNQVFKIDTEFSPEFVIWLDGIYEKVKDKWVNITNNLDKTVVIQRLLDINTPIIELHIETNGKTVFNVGALVRGINNRYGITDKNMYIGEIIHVHDDGNTISIRVIDHSISRYNGSVQEAQFICDGELMFELIE